MVTICSRFFVKNCRLISMQKFYTIVLPFSHCGDFFPWFLLCRVASLSWCGCLSRYCTHIVVVGSWFGGFLGNGRSFRRFLGLYSRAYDLVFLPILLKKNYLKYWLFWQRYNRLHLPDQNELKFNLRFDHFLFKT